MKKILLLGAMIAAIGSSFAQTETNTLTNGLVAYYPLNGDVNDHSGNGYNPSIINNIQFIEGRGFQMAAFFNGSNSYIQVSRIPTNSGSYTLSCWVLLNLSTINNFQPLINFGWDIGAWGYGPAVSLNGTNSSVVGASPGMIQFYNYNRSAEFINSQYTNSWNTNQWMHIVATRDSNNIGCLYVNGTLQGSSNISGGIVLPYFYIGANPQNNNYPYPSAPTGYLNGLISDIRIYSRALTSNEVTALNVLESNPWETYIVKSLPTNTVFFSALAKNTNFISALASSITASSSNYGISQVGPQGSAGPAGPQGPQGIQGPQGPMGVFDPIVLTNTAFLTGLASNTVFLNTLTTQILFGSNNYGVATKGDFTALAQQTSATNSSYVQAVATNPAFISALVAQPSFLNTTATNATFVASLTTNPSFVTAVAAQILTGSNNYGVAVKQDQSLNFPAMPVLTITPGRKYTNNVTTSSGLPVTQTSGNTAVATVSNNVLTLIGSGSTTITATQAGNALWNPVSASQPLIVTKGTQALTFTAIKPMTFTPYATVTLSCTSSAKLTNTTYSIDNGAVGSISNNVLLILGRGTATITATNSGNAYFALAFATRTLIVQ